MAVADTEVAVAHSEVVTSGAVTSGAVISVAVTSEAVISEADGVTDGGAMGAVDIVGAGGCLRGGFTEPGQDTTTGGH